MFIDTVDGDWYLTSNVILERMLFYGLELSFRGGIGYQESSGNVDWIQQWSGIFK